MTATLIAVEGIDGSGKSTQAERLMQRLRQHDYRVTKLKFPRYAATHFGKMITQYLNGDFGDIDAVPPQLSAALFAGDRYESKAHLNNLMQAHDVLLLDRYVFSNMAYHAARLPARARAEFIAWLGAVEYDVYALPKPDLTLFIDMPVAVGQTLMKDRAARDYTDKQADIHESRPDYLAQCRAVYQSLVNEQAYSHWETVACVDDNDALRSPDAIADDLWRITQQHLPAPSDE